MYAIIGAGPTGLAMARNLHKAGLPFRGFEIHADVGGLWDAQSPTSTMYESAHLISSKRTTEFEEFPMRDEVAQYPHHSELKRYFQDYARHFELYPHFEFATEVVRAERHGEQWDLTTRCDGQEQTRRFDGLMLCNGTLHEPNQPPLPGAFSGQVMHSSAYKSAQMLDGKRVLIIGCGNSGADIAVDAVHRAASVDMSLRRGYYFLPKFVLGRPIDTLGAGQMALPRPLKQFIDGTLIRALVGKPSNYGLPDPDYKLYEAHPVLNSLLLHHAGHGDVTIRQDIKHCAGPQVSFIDGSSAKYDLIIQATGYKLHYPFIDRDELNWKGAAPQLYLNCFHPDSDNIFMMGMMEAAGLGWEARNRQAELVALYLTQLKRGAASAKRLQSDKARLAGKRLDGGYAYLKLERMAYYVNKQAYNKALNARIAALKADLPKQSEQAA
ncbi:MAG: NAD(P)/FAD-dependent oxidoreductase [Oceanococcus sp.]|nr:MAG: NAD(P)/FAD-dependent oxidoreductase [Oceanococcus sp.]